MTAAVTTAIARPTSIFVRITSSLMQARGPACTGYGNA
jgi:hypothetical protein